MGKILRSERTAALDGDNIQFKGLTKGSGWKTPRRFAEGVVFGVIARFGKLFRGSFGGSCDIGGSSRAEIDLLWPSANLAGATLHEMRRNGFAG